MHLAHGKMSLDCSLPINQIFQPVMTNFVLHYNNVYREKTLYQTIKQQ